MSLKRTETEGHVTKGTKVWGGTFSEIKNRDCD